MTRSASSTDVRRLGRRVRGQDAFFAVSADAAPGPRADGEPDVCAPEFGQAPSVWLNGDPTDTIRSPMHPSPVIKSFLIADHVFRQEGGKWCIIGVFDRIFAPRFPCLHPSLGLFVLASEAVGRLDVRLELRDHKDRVLSTLQGQTIEIGSPLDVVSFGIQTAGLPIPAAGRYFFKLYFNGRPAVSDIHFDAVALSEDR